MNSFRMKQVINMLPILGLLIGLTANAQSPETHRFEIEGGAGAFMLPKPYRTGFLYRQQLTTYIAPRLGVALGINWGSSSDTRPLNTIDPRDPYQADPAQIKSLYQRTERMSDLSLVWLLPIRTKRHQIRVQGGIAHYVRRETGVDSLLYPSRLLPRPYDDPQYGVVPKAILTRQFAPVVSVGYDFRPSERWSVGVLATRHFAQSGATTTLGIRAGYRLGIRADSLGITPVRWNEAIWGLRATGSAVSANGFENAQYRLRFNGGIWAELPLSLTWSVRGELNYAQRGYQSPERQRGNTRYLSSFGTADYLELPILFRHEVAYRWRLYGGPYLAFFLNGYSEADGKRNPPVPSHTVSGIMLGLSRDLTDRLAFDARYQRDMLTLTSTPYGGFHSFQAGLTWQLKKQ